MSVLEEYRPKAFNKRKTIVERFSSAEEVIRMSDQRPITKTFTEHSKNTRARIDMGDEADWFGNVNTWQEVANLMSYGYRPYVEQLKDKLDFTARGEGKRISFRNDVVGYAPIVPLAMMGVPRSMINSYMKPIKNKVVSIYYEKTANWTIDAKEIEKAGLKLLSVLLSLEMQGYRFNLNVCETHVDEKKEPIILCVKVKDSNMPFDLQRLSFPVGHPAFFRGVGFDWYERCPKAKYMFGYGHEIVREYPEAVVNDGFEEMFNEKCVVFHMSKLIDDTEEHIASVITNSNKMLA